jgi:N-methylhydantoinase A
MPYRIGVDIGGTFTDIVLDAGDGTVLTRKVLSTPDDYSRAIGTALEDLFRTERIDAAEVTAVVHGTTIATNAILEGRGARTALITTAGFRDVLELRRIRVPELYNFDYEKPAPLVSRRLRFEVRERVNAKGAIVRPLDEASVEAALDRVEAAEVEALAIGLLHAYANPAHEHEIARRARERLGRDVFICCSADILPELREYERLSTTVINAYVGPVVERYVSALEARLRSLGVTAPLQIMQSSGGILGASSVVQKPAYIVESGPAAGVIGAAVVARRSGTKNLITIDMGGTTAKASMVEGGEVTKTAEYEVGAGINISSHLVKGRGHALRLPVIDVSEIGAGGGSLARVDAAGLLHVGPQSAGAMPGPVCYRQGGRTATLTDAMLVLGYINPEALVGGALRLDAEAARRAVEEQIATPMGRSPLDAAWGVYILAAATMTRAVKAVSTFRGRDPREFRLFAFGGNGPLMAAIIAEALQIEEVIVPPLPGVFSAAGLLAARLEEEFSQSLFRHADDLDPTEMEDVFASLERRATEALTANGCRPETIGVRRAADLRYSGQAYELTVPVAPGAAAFDLIEAFSSEHERTYGHRAVDEPVDLVSLRVSAAERVSADGSAVQRPRRGGPGKPPRQVYFGEKHGAMTTPVISRIDLETGGRSGPLVIEEYDATCVVPPGWSVRLDADGNLLLGR